MRDLKEKRFPEKTLFSVIDLVKARALEIYEIYSYINPCIIGRKLGITTEIVKGHLWKLGFIEDELKPGRFIREEDRDKAKDKEDYSHLDDIAD